MSTIEDPQLEIARKALDEASTLVIRLGGKAGRLGECVVATGLLEATLQVLRATQREGIPLRLVVDEGAAELFDARLYQKKYWPQITIEYVPYSTHLTPEALAEHAPSQRVLALDFHGGHDGMPDSIQSGTVTQLTHLFRTGIRNYATRGPERRYADFVEDLFALPARSIQGALAQPRLYLAAEDKLCYSELTAKFGLDTRAIQVMCFFQSVVLAKCYERWDEAMQLLCTDLARSRPGQRIDFLVACGPEQDLPEGFKRPDMEEWFQGIARQQGNAQVRVDATASLRELALLIQHAKLVLANDTGPGHIAGALGVPVVTPYLPGNLYSRRVWSSTLWHHGVTLEPNPYSLQQLKAAVLWGKTDIINSIPPEKLYTEMRACLA